MKKVLLIIGVIAFTAFALIDATIPNTFSPNTPARSAEVNENFDSLETATNRLIDSLSANYAKYSDFDSASTTFNKMFIDTLRSKNARFDSVWISDGNGTFDSIHADKALIVDGEYTSVNILDGKAILDSATITKFTATNATITNSSGTSLVYDTIYSRAFAGDDLNADTILALGLVATRGAIDTIISDKITSSVSSIGEATATTFNANTVNTGNGNNELFDMDQNVTTASDVIFDSIAATKGVFSSTLTSATLSTGNGDNELYPMNQAVRTTDDVIFDSIAATKIVVSSSSSLGAATATTLNTGNGAYELYAMNQDVETTDGVTFATVNTGNGANELYPMNQGVLTTSDVVFDSLYTTSSSSAKTYIDTINQLQHKTYAKSDSLLYSAKGSTEYLLSALQNVSSMSTQYGWRSDAAYTGGVSMGTSGLTLRSIISTADTIGRYSALSLVANSTSGGNAVFNLGLVKKATNSPSADVIFQLRKTNQSYFEHCRMNETGELQINNTAETIATPSGGAKLYASGGQLFADDTTGEAHNLTPHWISFTLTLSSGCTTNPTETAKYLLKDSVVTLDLPSLQCGNSNSTGLQYSGLPTAIRPPDGKFIEGVITQDSNGTRPGAFLVSSGGVLIVWVLNSGYYSATGFLNNNDTKGLSNSHTITYSLK